VAVFQKGSIAAIGVNRILNWTTINDGLNDQHVYSLAIDPQNPNIIWAGTQNSGVFRMVQSN